MYSILNKNISVSQILCSRRRAYLIIGIISVVFAAFVFVGASWASSISEYEIRMGENTVFGVDEDIDQDYDSSLANKTLTHTVRVGNTLMELSLSYGTEIETIKSMNSLSSDVLHAGQELQVPSKGTIVASWYGSFFNNKPMANQEPYHINKPVIAHRYLPLGTCVELHNPDNGLTTVAQVQDRIAQRYAHRWDLSPRVFSQELGVNLDNGLAQFDYLITDCSSAPPDLLAYMKK